MNLFDLWHKFLTHGKYFIVLFWLATSICGFLLMGDFLQNTKLKFKLPDGSEGLEAFQETRDLFPEIAKQTGLIVVLSQEFNNHQNVSVINIHSASFELEVRNWILNYKPEGFILNYQSYYYFQDKNMTMLASSLYKKDTTKDITLISILFDEWSMEQKNFYKSFSSLFDKWTKHYFSDTTVLVRLAGLPTMLHESQEGTQKTLHKMDEMIFPIAMVVLCLVLRSIKLMLIPICCMGSSLLSSFFLMYFISLKVNVASFAPSVMLSAILAMSVDYSLFLLTRFREEKLNNKDTATAVFIMSKTAGKTVLISGLTLSICFLGLAIFPMDLIASIGISAAVGILCTLSVNLTLAPSLLLILRRLYAHFSPVSYSALGASCVRKMFGGKKPHCEKEPLLQPSIQANDGSLVGEEASATPHPRPTGEGLAKPPAALQELGLDDLNLETERDRQRRSAWFKLGKMVTSYPLIVTLFFLVAAGFLGYFALQIKTTVEIRQLLPSDSQALETVNNLETTFGSGIIAPYQLLMKSKHKGVLDMSPDSMLGREFFDVSCIALKYLFAHVDGLSVNYTQSPTAIMGADFGGCIYYPLAVQLLQPEFQNLDLARTYSFFFNHSVSEDRSATITTIYSEMDPFGNKAPDFISSFRAALHTLNHNQSTIFNSTINSYTFYLNGGGIPFVDCVDAINSRFPFMIAVTTAFIFLFAAVAFKTAFIPFRLLITIATTVAFTYGISDFVLEHQTFASVFPGLIPSDNKIVWVVPLMSFSITVGLGLDYDVFLLSRVLEYRLDGFSTRSSILNGLYKTGHIISCAGVIMTIAFSGLFLSPMLVLKEFAFFLCVSVLLDTFVIRPMLVPAMMTLVGPLNWWPRKVPDDTGVLKLCTD